MANDDDKSEIALALEARAKDRKTQLVEGMAFCGPGSKVVGAVALRVATKQEENAAIAQAEAYVSGLSKQAAAELRDPELVRDARAVFILSTVCMDPKHASSMPAFPGGAWMMKHFTRDEIAVLLSHYNRFADAESPLDSKLDEEVFEAFTTQLAQYADTEIADAMVQRKDRIWLEQFAIMSAIRLGHARKDVAALEALRVDDAAS